MEYDNRNTFVLFRNDKKGNDRAPDYRGAYVDSTGVEMDCAAWVKVSKKGDKFLSGKISAKRQQSAPSTNHGQTPSVDEDVPF